MRRRPATRTLGRLALLAALLCAEPAAAAVPAGPARGARPARAAGPQTLDLERRLDVNRLTVFATNHGSIGYDLQTGGAGLHYPRGSGRSVVFASGLWLGAMVAGAPRAVVAEYSSEFGPGGMVGGTFDDPSRPQHVTYKVARFTGDPLDTARVQRTPGQLAADPTLDPLLHHSWSEYLRDAVPYGAPTRVHRLPDTGSPAPDDSVDVLGPDVAGDVMLWSVYNDADSARHTNRAGNSLPLGVEVRQRLFGFDRNDPLGRALLLEITLLNRGANLLEESYLSWWSDPDLGGFTDDLVGFDSTRAMGYVYNSTATDLAYGRAAPALGVVLLRGPRDDGVLRGPRAFSVYVNGTDPDSPAASYNYMRGRLPDGGDRIDPVTGLPTRYQYPGDVLAGTGWRDGSPSDKRALLTTGPFTLAPGDTQVVVLAIVVGQGAGALASLADLGCAVDYVRQSFAAGYATPPPAALDCPSALAPIVTGIAPLHGRAGDSLAVAGEQFQPAPGATRVSLGGTAAAGVVVAASALSLQVPPGASLGPVQVVAGGRSARSLPFLPTFPSAGLFDSLSFSPLVPPATAGPPRSVALADLDGAGGPDLIVRIGPPEGIELRRNLGSPGAPALAPATTLALPDSGATVAVADLDGDGRPDLVADLPGNGKVAIFRNLSTPGSIQFAPPVEVTTLVVAPGVVAEDLDGDGRLDLAAGDAAVRNLSRPDTLEFSAPTLLALGAGRTIAADVDGDGRPDLLSARDGVSVARNSGAPGRISFALDPTIDPGDSLRGAALVDLDRDGRPDLVTVGDTLRVRRNVSVLGSIAFAARQVVAVRPGLRGIAAASLDGDSLPDLLVTSDRPADRPLVLLNRTAAPGAIVLAPALGVAAGPAADVAAADLDLDGKPDAALASRTDGGLALLRNLAPDFRITAVAGPDGSISPAGVTGVLAGGDLAFTISPAPGHRVLDVLVDGLSVGVQVTYTFRDVRADHTIEARFVLDVPTEFAVRGDLFVTDGTVRAAALSPGGGTLYVGGDFTRVGPATGGGVPLDGLTGAPPAAFPKVAGLVHAVASDGAGGWYIGGLFTAVSGVPRTNLAHVRADGTVGSWNPAPNDVVTALAVRGGAVFVGGAFTTIGGAARLRLAALDGTTGIAGAWTANANSIVYALAIGDSTVYAGGAFTSVGGSGRNHLAAIDAGSGAVLPWDPAANATVLALAVGGGRVFAGGTFSIVAGQSRPFLAAMDAASGVVTPWNPGADGTVHALAMSDSRVHIGGAFTTVAGSTRNRLAAVDAASGVIQPWNPNANGPVFALVASGGTIYVGGDFTTLNIVGRLRLAAVDAASGSLLAAWNPSANAPVYALAASGATVYAAGDFTSVGGVARNRLAALRLDTGAVTAWDPNANGPVHALLAVDGSVYAGGAFTTLRGATPASRLAQLDTLGGAPLPLGVAPNGLVHALARVGAELIVAGDFTQVGPTPRNRLAAVSLSAGTLTAWNPNAGGPVYALAARGATVYAGGAFTTMGGGITRLRIAAVSAGTGALTSWNPGANAPVYALAVSGNRLFAAGDFTTLGGPVRRFLGALDLTSGTATSWNPDANSWARAVSVGGLGVHAGGDFTGVGPAARHRFAALDSVTGAPLALDPGANSVVRALVSDGYAVHAGGDFTSIGRLPHSGVASIVPTEVLHTIIATAGAGGSITPAGAVRVSPGRDQLFTILPDPGYRILDVQVDSVSVGPVPQYAFTNVQGGHTITASFTLDLLTITAAAGPGGAISPSGSVPVPRGQNRTFTIAPDAGYRIAGVTVDAAPIGAVGEYTFTNVQADHAIAATFEAQEAVVRGDLYVTDGEVRATALSPAGDLLYIGGAFARVGPATGQGVPIDRATALPLAPLPAVAGGPVLAVIPDGAGGWYLGGGFTFAAGQPRAGLARVLADGTLSPWNPGANGPVQALALRGSVLYAGGQFTLVAGAARNRIAAIDATTGNAHLWNPNADGAVLALAVSGPTVYAAGAFNGIGGAIRSRIAALDSTTGAARPWNPSATGGNVAALAVVGPTVYAGGSFTGIGGAARARIAALDAGGLATPWNPGANGGVQALLASGARLYAGGTFTTIGGANRDRIAALALASGAALAWNPGASSGVNALAAEGATVYVGGGFGSIGGVTRHNLAAIDSGGAVTAWNPSANGTVRALAVSGARVFAGGDLTSVGAVTRNRIAAVDVGTGVVTAWNPNADGTVHAIEVSPAAVYAGGEFTAIGGQPRAFVAAVDPGSGNATVWNPGADGRVRALELRGPTLYIGGEFGLISGAPRPRLAAVDAASGVVRTWNPGADGAVTALVAGDSVVYAGGSFAAAGGLPRAGIAALDAVTGDPRPWNPGAGGTVWALALRDSTLYAGGDFTTLGGQPRGRLAALHARTAAVLPWDPGADAAVHALAVAGSSVYAGGDFSAAAGEDRSRLAALDAASGAALPWDPRADGGVRSLAVGTQRAFAGGGFAAVGGRPQSGLAGITAAAPSFTITATAGPHGAIAPAGAVVVPQGADQTFTFAADVGYRVAEVRVDGDPVGAPGAYTFVHVVADHAIDVRFASDSLGTPTTAGAYLLRSHGFETPRGECRPRGWTARDLSSRVFAHVADRFLVNDGFIAMGTRALWVGADSLSAADEVADWVHPFGYGNGWSQRLTSPPFARAGLGDVVLRFDAAVELTATPGLTAGEGGNDFVAVQGLRSDGLWELLRGRRLEQGAGPVTARAVGGSGSFRYEVRLSADGNAALPLADPLRLRIVVQSDAIGSSEDGRVPPGAGAALIDNVTLRDSLADVLPAASFEDGTTGVWTLSAVNGAYGPGAPAVIRDVPPPATTPALRAGFDGADPSCVWTFVAAGDSLPAGAYARITSPWIALAAPDSQVLVSFAGRLNTLDQRRVLNVFLRTKAAGDVRPRHVSPLRTPLSAPTRGGDAESPFLAEQVLGLGQDFLDPAGGDSLQVVFQVEDRGEAGGGLTGRPPTRLPILDDIRVHQPLADADHDGVADVVDACPEASAEGQDEDGDGCADSTATLRHVETWGRASRPIPFAISQAADPTIVDASDLAAVRAGFLGWQVVPGADVPVLEEALTTQTDAAALDGVNLVTFQDADFPFQPNVLAVTPTTSFTRRREFDDRVVLPGEIVDADLIFNPLVRFATPSRPGSFDLQSVATHEIGHFLGIGHSGVLDATMFFVLQQGGLAASLTADDAAAVAAAYPGPTFAADYATIRGSVRRGGTLQPVPGALVTAVRLNGGGAPADSAASDYTDEQGRYALRRLAPGGYSVRVTPLNGDVGGFPMRPEHVGPRLAAIARTDFPAEWWSEPESDRDDPALRGSLALAAGELRDGIDVTTTIDTLPPAVVSVLPADGAVDVPIGSPLLVRFSEPVLPATLKDAFRLAPDGASSTLGGNGALVGDRDFVFPPAPPLEYGRRYRIRISTVLTDLEGLPLATEFTSTFTTESRPTVALTNLHPAAGPAGSIVTLIGVGFDPAPGAVNQVVFTASGGSADTVAASLVTPTSLVATVPAGAASGPVVAVVAGPQVSNPLAFSVAPRGPLIAPVAGVTPTSLGFPPTDVALAPDGRTAYVVGDGGFSTVDLGSPSRPVRAHSTTRARSIALTPDGAWGVITRPERGEVDVVDARPTSGRFGLPEATLPLGGKPTGVAVSPDGRRAYVTDGLEGRVRVLDLDPASLSARTELPGIAVPNAALSGAVAVDPRGDRLYVTTADRGLLALDPANPGAAPVVLHPTSLAGGIAIPPGGTEVLAAGGSLAAALVAADLPDAVGLGSQITLGGTPRDVAIHPQGRSALVVNGLFHEVQVVDLDPASRSYHRAVASVPTGRAPVAIAVSAGGGVVAVANSGDRNLSVYSTVGADGSPVRVFPDAASPGDVVGVETANESYAGGALGDLGSGPFPASNPTANGVGLRLPAQPSAQRLTALTLQDLLGTRSLSLPLRIVDRIEEHAPKLPSFPAGPPPADCVQGPGAATRHTALRLSPDGRLLAAALGYDSCPSVIRLYQASADGSEVFGAFLAETQVAAGVPVLDLAFSPDGRRLFVSLVDADLMMVDSDRASPDFGRLLGPVPPPFAGLPAGLATDPLGRFVVAGGDAAGPLLALRGADGALLDTVRTPATPRALAVSGDGRYLVAGLDGQALVVALPAGIVVATTPPHAGAGATRAVAVTADGRRAAGLFANSSLAVWNLDPGAGPVGAETYFGTPFPAVQVSSLLAAPDGDGLLAGCGDCDLLFKVEPSLAPPDVRTASLGQTSARIARSADGRRLWVAETGGAAGAGAVRVFGLGGATAIDLVSGAGQSARPGQTLPLPVQVRLLDPAGRPQVGTVVTFALSGDDPGTLDGQPVRVVRRITDVDGLASARWTLGGTLGTSSLQLSAIGVAATRVLTAEAVASDAEIFPQVTRFGPPNGSVDLNAGTAVYARFNQRMSATSVAAGMTLRAPGGAVAGTFEFEEEGRVAILRPGRALPFSARCTLRVAAGTRDLDGQGTAVDAVALFMTEPPPPVALAAIAPPAAPVGAPLVLDGKGFSPIAAQNLVIVNGRLAPVARASSTSLVASVPPGAVSGPVTVIVGATTSNALPLEVLAPNAAPGESLGTVAAGRALSDIAITPDGRRAYVTSPSTNSVSALDIRTSTFLGTITVGLEPRGIAVLPDGRRAYVANFGSDDVSVIDIDPASPTFHKEIDRVPVGDGPVDLVASGAGPTVYVGNLLEATLSVLDANPGNGTYHQVVSTVNTGSGCTSITITADAARIYAGTLSGVVMIDLGSQVVTTVNTGSGCTSITITADATLALALLEDGRLIVIDAVPGSTTFNRVVTTVNTGTGSTSVSVAPDATLAYVTSADGNVVLVYQIVKLSAGGAASTVPGPAVTLTLVATIPVGDGPADVAIDPSGNRFALVSNQGSGTVTIIGFPSEPPPLPIAFTLHPRTLNPESQGRWVTGRLEPPAPYRAEDIVAASVRVNGAVPADETGPSTIEDDDGDGIPERVLKFERAALQLVLPAGDAVAVRVDGSLGTRRFFGHDTLRVKAGRVTHPRRDEIVNPFEPYTVRWETPKELKVPWVALVHSLDRGATWRIDAKQLPNKGFAEWQAPPVLAESVLVAVVQLQPAPEDSVIAAVLGTSDFFRLSTPTASEPSGPRLEFATLRPNPANGFARLRFGLAQRGRVDLELFDVQGRRLVTLVAGDREAGWHEATWDGSTDAGGRAGSGLYFARLRAGGREFLQRLVWLR